MNKQYVFLTMITVILYILYLILSFSIEEYEIDKHITKIENFIEDTQQYNKKALWIIEYKQSSAYKNMILKEEQWLKNKWEKVVYLTTQENYNKYTQEVSFEKTQEDIEVKTYKPTDNMSIQEKWIHFLKNDL